MDDKKKVEKKVKEKKLPLREIINKISFEMNMEKKGYNPYDKYKYFTPSKISAEVKKFKKIYNLFSYFTMAWNTEINMYNTNMEIEDLDTHEKLNYPMDIPISHLRKTGVIGPQDMGSTMTYGKRYSWMNIFDIDDDSADPDSKKPVDSYSKPKPTVKPKSINFEVFKKSIDKQSDFDELTRYKSKIPKIKGITEAEKTDLIKLIDNKLPND